MTARVRRRRVDLVNVGLVVWAVAALVFLYLPIVFVVIYSFTDNRDLTRWGGFTTEWYSRLADNQQLLDTVWNSFRVAIYATPVSVVLGGLAGIALARRPGAWTRGFLVFVFLILVTPEIVDAIGLQVWFVNLADQVSWLGGPLINPSVPVIRNLFPMMIGHVIFSSAVVTLIVRARMAGLDESLEEAAADLYAPPRRAFFQITLPLVFPALLAGGLLSFTFSLDNVIISQFVSRPGSSTFPLYVFGKVRSVLRPDLAAASTLILLATLFALAVVVAVLRRSGDSSTDIAATLTGGA
jgi:ABC-type spermidine/putrescine transport system permease subunit II